MCHASLCLRHPHARAMEACKTLGIDIGELRYGYPHFDLSVFLMTVKYSPEGRVRELYHMDKNTVMSFSFLPRSSLLGSRYSTLRPNMSQKIGNHCVNVGGRFWNTFLHLKIARA